MNRTQKLKPSRLISADKRKGVINCKSIAFNRELSNRGNIHLEILKLLHFTA